MKRASAVGLSAAALGLALVPVPGAPWLALVIATGAALLLEPAVLRRAWTGRTLLVAVLASGVTAAVVAWAGTVPAGLRAGLAMLLRLLVLVVVTTLAARHVDHESWHRGMARLGFQRLGLVCGLALNTMPHLAEAWRDAWIALAVRRRRRRPRWSDLPALAETLLAHAGRLADETAVAAALRGRTELSLAPSPLAGSPQVVAVTGRSGSGKTPAMTRLVETLMAHGVPVFGFLQPPLWCDGNKVGFDIVDVRSGARAPLGRRVAAEHGQHGTPFTFDGAGFDLARQALAAPPRDAVLIVDEIGPVELRGGGHWPAVASAWKRARVRAAVLTVRRQLIPAFLELLGATEVMIVDAEADPDPAATALAALVSVLPAS